MSETSLSLFKDLIDDRTAPRSSVVTLDQPRVDTQALQQRHLLAARRLSRKMARFADQSPEQLRVGRQICRHLVAMLKEAQTSPRPHESWRCRVRSASDS